MIWWIRNRGALRVVLAAALMALVSVLSAGTLLTIPSLAGLESVRQPLGFFTPLLGITVVAWSLGRADVLLEGGGVRPVAWWALALCTVGPLVLCVAGAPTGSTVCWVAARNLTVGTGLVLLVGCLGPREFAALPAVGWILVGVLTGRSYGFGAWWNWPVMEAGDPRGVLWVAACAAVGGVAHLLRARRPHRSSSRP